MIVKKSTLTKAGAILGGLLLISLFVLLTGPVLAAENPCGDGVCDPTSENNDLCPEDCQCIDNGIVDPGEGCACKDVICESEGESISSACGTYVTIDGACPGNLVNFGGVCWSRCECEGICSEGVPAPAAPVCIPDGQCSLTGGFPWDCCGGTLTADIACSSGWRCAP